MKKKILAMVMAVAMCGTMVVGCGDSEAAAPAPAATTAATTAATAAVDENAPVSDATFAELQEGYAAMVEAYEAVAALYSSDEIAANKDIEEVMNEAADIINQMGEITQDSVTEKDAEDLADAMVSICEALGNVVDGMEVVETEQAASAETVATLQENYTVLEDLYSKVTDLYMSNVIPQNDDVEQALATAAGLIDEVGAINVEDITEENAVEINDAMVEIVNFLGEIVDAM